MKKQWSEEEISYVKAHFQTTKYKDLAVTLNSTTDAIKKLIRLKLKLSKPVSWPPEFVEILKAEYYTTPAKELAVRLGKSVTAMHQFANKLGMKMHEKNPDWSEQEIGTLKELFPTHTTKALSEILGRPMAGVQSKSNDLGLKKVENYRNIYLSEHRIKGSQALKGHTPWNKKEPILKTCKNCSKQFGVIPARAKRANFCCKNCLSEWMKTVKGEEHWHYTKVKRDCQQCGKEFTCVPAKVKYGEGKFCSRSCLGSHTSRTLSIFKGPTSIERKVAEWLKGLDIDFETQYSIGPWVVDVFLPGLDVVIECDGDYWHSLEETVKRDRRKEYYLRKHKFTLYRFTESEINKIGPSILMPLLNTYNLVA